MKKYLGLSGVIAFVLALGVFAGGTSTPFPTWLTRITGAVSFSEEGVTSIDDGEIVEADLQATSAEGNNVLRIAHGTYNFSTDGGGTVATPVDLGADLPANATIVRSWYYVKTALTTAAGTPGNIDIRCEDGGNIVASAAITAFGTGFNSGTQTGTTSTNTAGIAAECALSLGIATHSLNAGNFEVWVEYVASSNN